MAMASIDSQTLLLRSVHINPGNRMPEYGGEETNVSWVNRVDSDTSAQIFITVQARVSRPTAVGGEARQTNTFILV